VNADYAVKTNVADESGDANSVLSFYRMLIRLRNDHAALRVGDSIIVDSGNDAVFAQLRVSKNEVVLVVVNLSGEEVSEFALTLASGPLSGIYVAASMLGKGRPSNPVVNAQGGFDDYKPVSSLPAFGSLIIQLQPQK
jgi:glycosidase